MARKMGRNLKRAAAVLVASAAIALCAVSPAWGEERAGDIVNVTVPTRIDCALGADGTVTSPGGLEVVNIGPQDLYVGASTLDDFGQKVEFAIDLGGSPLLSRTGGKDVEGEVEFAGSSRKALALAVSKLNRTSHAALMDAAAQGEAPMFTVGFRFTFKALQGSMSISGEAKLGKTLTAAVTGAQADAKLAYRWYREGQLIAGAESASYTTNGADLGKKLKCEAYDAAGRYVGAVSAEVGPIKGPEAFAVFSADDGSLNFYKRIDVPKAGEQFEGRTVTEVYTGFERGKFSNTNSEAEISGNWFDQMPNTPWWGRKNEILAIEVIDRNIKPDSVSYWFYGMQNLATIDVSKLDTSLCQNFKMTFGLCSKLKSLDLSAWSTKSLTALDGTFLGCLTINSLNINSWDTARVRSYHCLLDSCQNLDDVAAQRIINNLDVTNNAIDLGLMFALCPRITKLDLSHFDTSGIENMSYIFSDCTSLGEVNLSGINTANVTNMKGMFRNCYKLKHLGLPGLITKSVKDLSLMFSGCSELTTLDLSGLDTSSVIYMDGIFESCNNLRQIELGSNFSWKSKNGYLPTPSPKHIAGADGKWYALSDKKGYTPADIPSNKADTYVASPDMLPKETFAVFSEDDGSLNFYHRNIVPTMGSQFEGKTATHIYTKFDERVTHKIIDGHQYPIGPWYEIRDHIKSAKLVDRDIRPIYLDGWFAFLDNCTTISGLRQIDYSRCKSMRYLFLRNRHLTTIDLSNLSFPECQSFGGMFEGCKALVEADLSNITVKSNNQLDLWFMFGLCENVERIDLSGWNVDQIITSRYAFSGCKNLRQISLPNNFTWPTSDSYLPTPSASNIPGADGYWYDAATGDAYKPEEIPSNKAATYVAVNPVKAPTVTIEGEAVYGSTLTAKVSGQPAGTTATSYQWQYLRSDGEWHETGLPGAQTNSLTLTADSNGSSCEGQTYRCVVSTTAGKKRVPQGISQAVGPVDAAPTGEAFAVYSAYDKSLNFYKRTNVPSNGDWYDGRTATEVYRDIETTRYYDRLQPGWRRYNDSITKVRFFEPIRPISTSYWFYGFTTANIDLSKLYTSSVTDMSYMFYNCSYAPNLGVSHFDTSNVTNMNRMFYNCSSVSKLDLANFDTSNVTNMNYMFGGCSSLTTIDMSGFDTSNVSNMDWMYSGCSKLRQVTLGAKFAWKSTYGYLPTPSGGQWYATSDGRGYAPEDIPSNKADTYYASKSLLPVTADEAPEAVMPDVEPCGDAAGTGAGPEVEADAIGSEAVVPGEAENEESERKPDEDVGAGTDGDEKLDESGSEMASAAASPPEEDCLVPVTSDEAQ